MQQHKIQIRPFTDCMNFLLHAAGASVTLGTTVVWAYTDNPWALIGILYPFAKAQTERLHPLVNNFSRYGKVAENHFLQVIVNEISESLGLKPPAVYISDSVYPSQGAMTSLDNKGIIFSREIVDESDLKELRGIAAHELAHIYKRHDLQQSFLNGAAEITGSIIAFGFVARACDWAQGNFSTVRLAESFGAAAVAIGASLLAFKLMNARHARIREMQSDRIGAMKTSPKIMEHMLKKGLSRMMALDQGYSRQRYDEKNIFLPHPPILQRIGMMRAMNNGKNTFPRYFMGSNDQPQRKIIPAAPASNSTPRPSPRYS